MDIEKYKEVLEELKTIPLLSQLQWKNGKKMETKEALQFSIDLITRYRNCKGMPKEKQVRYEKTDRTMALATGKITAEHQQITYDKEAEIHNACLAECKMFLLKRGIDVDFSQ